MTLKRMELRPPAPPSAAERSKAPTTLDPPFVRTVAPSRTKCCPKLAIFSLLSFALCTNNRPLLSRWFLTALKSPAESVLLFSVVIRYRWNKSVPAESEIGFGVADFKASVFVFKRERVSEIVDAVLAPRASTRDSMAATGMVRSGSDARRRL